MSKHFSRFLFSLVIIFVLTALLGVSVLFRDNDNTTPPTQEINIFEDLTYSAMGDSITYGTSYTTDNPQGPKWDNPYPSVVKDLLGLKRVNNYGWGGSTIASAYMSMATRYTNISKNSDIISVQGGNNDSGNVYAVELGTINDTDNTTFYGALNVLVQGIQKNYPSAFFFMITRFPSKSWTAEQKNTAGYNMEQYVIAMQEIGKKYNVPVLDMFHNAEILEDLKTNSLDGSHPSQECHTNIIAPLVAQFIKDNYKK